MTKRFSRHHLALLLSFCLAVMAISSARVASAQTDHQKAQNLATCLDGRYPILCKRGWLSAEERSKVDAAERSANLKTCLDGRYPSLCNKGRLSREEATRVAAAERRENLKTCETGKYPSLCKKSLLTEEERARVVAAERAENLRTCSSGRYPALCNHSLLTADQRKDVMAAEARERAARPQTSRTARRAGRGGGSSSGCEDGHWVESVSDDGTIVKLEDGSVWEVDEVDAIDSMLWLPATDIIACGDMLINTDDNEKVSARRLR